MAFLSNAQLISDSKGQSNFLFNNNNVLKDKILISNMGQEVMEIITDIRSAIIQKAKQIYPKLRLT